jgi:HD-GYP domain-containing protein (c-di-GMP phosphodiesterase class II)
VLGTVSHHSHRVACMSARAAESLGASREEISDLVSLALLHDNGLAEATVRRDAASTGPLEIDRVEGIREHCRIGEQIIDEAPFDGRHRGVILSHHENHDGSGYFGIRGAEIPWFARIIHAADAVALAFDLRDAGLAAKQASSRMLEEGRGSRFDPEVVTAFQRVMRRPAFWLDLREEHIEASVKGCSSAVLQDLDYARLRQVTRTFSRVIDYKSRFTRRHSRGLRERSVRMAAQYGWGEEDSAQLEIAADLHDIGKLTVPNAILDKPGPLSAGERDIVENHTYYTRMVVKKISGFERITEWASNHHERLDGSGYPFGLAAAGLDPGSRLLAVLDSYQALTEDRPYREALPHDEALVRLRAAASEGRLDPSIVRDIDAEFG